MRSPKLGAITGRSTHYRYYAGYSAEFVEDMLADVGLSPSDLLIDPWNGSGTTTGTAAARGLRARGFDVNPAAVLIGRYALLGPEVAGSLVPLANEIKELSRKDRILAKDDLLLRWFGPQTASTLRALERSTYSLTVDHLAPLGVRRFTGDLPHSSLAAAFYVALFQLVRGLVKPYLTSNPAWIKNPRGRRIGIERQAIEAGFIEAVASIVYNLEKPEQLELSDVSFDAPAVKVDLGSSHKLPLANESVDAILSSPPYCTRLDYVKATLPELAIIGLDEDSVRELRDNMIGTPTITSRYTLDDDEKLGPQTAEFLTQVSEHGTYASKSYYVKYYRQYFSGMQHSLNELHRTLKSGRPAVLVVQDSYFKDVHIDLAALLGDMALSNGWSEWSRVDFAVPRTMASINPGSRRYRKNFRATESALLLSK